MSTKNLNTDLVDTFLKVNIVGLVVKNDNYKFVEMADTQSENFVSTLKKKYNNIIKVNELIDEQSQILHDCTHLNPIEFFNLTEKELDDRDVYYDLEGGIRIFKTLHQVVKFSYVNSLFLFENNKWYCTEPSTIRTMLNISKLNTVTLNEFIEI